MRVAVSSPSFSKSPVLVSELKDSGVEVVGNPSGARLDEQGLVAFWRDAAAEAAIVGLEPVTAEVLDACPHIRFVAKYGVGLDNLDVQAMRDRNVALGWTPGVNKRSVTELTLAFSFGHMRNVFMSVRRMASGEWLKEGGRQVSDAVFGIVGLGSIGTDLARALRAMGTTVIYNDIEDRSEIAEELSLRPTRYGDLIAEADIVSFHVPSTESTRWMFGRKEIGIARPETFVINTARGDIVDFQAVVDAVREGSLGGYAADVFPSEPMDMVGLRDVPGLYFTPHIGGNAREAVLAMGRSAIGHVRRFLESSGPA